MEWNKICGENNEEMRVIWYLKSWQKYVACLHHRLVASHGQLKDRQLWILAQILLMVISIPLDALTLYVFIFRLSEKASPRSWPFSTKREELFPRRHGRIRSTLQRILDTKALRLADSDSRSTRRVWRQTKLRRSSTTSSSESSPLLSEMSF